MPGKLHSALQPFLLAIENYLSSMGSVKKGLLNLWLGDKPVYGTFQTEAEACTFKVSRGPKISLIDGTVDRPDAVVKLPMAEVAAIFNETVADWDRKVEQGIIRITVNTGKGDQLVKQVRSAFDQ